MLHRRSVLAAAGAALAAPRLGQAADATGITATEIRIGNTTPYSGPASAYGTIAQAAMAAVFQMVNEQGGIAGRKINFISYDDGYSPPKTVEQMRRLVEQDQVAFLFNTLGTPTNTPIVRYVNQRKVPHLFLVATAPTNGATTRTPLDHGLRAQLPDRGADLRQATSSQRSRMRKIALLYQNDDFGKDYLAGLRDVLGDASTSGSPRSPTRVTDPTIDSQLVACRQPAPSAADRRHAEIRRHGDPQGPRARLEADCTSSPAARSRSAP